MSASNLHCLLQAPCASTLGRARNGGFANRWFIEWDSYASYEPRAFHQMEILSIWDLFFCSQCMSQASFSKVDEMRDSLWLLRKCMSLWEWFSHRLLRFCRFGARATCWLSILLDQHHQIAKRLVEQGEYLLQLKHAQSTHMSAFVVLQFSVSSNLDLGPGVKTCHVKSGDSLGAPP